MPDVDRRVPRNRRPYQSPPKISILADYDPGNPGFFGIMSKKEELAASSLPSTLIARTRAHSSSLLLAARRYTLARGLRKRSELVLAFSSTEGPLSFAFGRAFLRLARPPPCKSKQEQVQPRRSRRRLGNCDLRETAGERRICKLCISSGHLGTFGDTRESRESTVLSNNKESECRSLSARVEN